jgi:hypothetical protein
VEFVAIESVGGAELTNLALDATLLRFEPLELRSRLRE